MENFVELKKEMESILPTEVLAASQKVGEHLSSSLENHKRFNAVIIPILEKIAVAKKTIEHEIDDLMSQRISLINETTDIINDRADKVRTLDTLLGKKEADITVHEETIKSLGVQINSINRELDGLYVERDNITMNVETLSGTNQQMIRESKKILQETDDAKTQRQEALANLEAAQGELEKVNGMLKQRRNEVIIAEDRLKELK